MTIRERWEIINRIMLLRGYMRYLEIGVYRGECLEQINAAYKHGVDPNPLCSAGLAVLVSAIASNGFFATNPIKFDFIFIDGLHTEKQALIDIANSINHLNSGGMIMLDDCLPPSEDRATDEWPGPNHFWNGTVWKAALRAFNSLTQCCYMLNEGQGYGFIDFAGPPKSPSIITLPEKLTWLEHYPLLRTYILPTDEVDRRMGRHYTNRTLLV